MKKLAIAAVLAASMLWCSDAEAGRRSRGKPCYGNRCCRRACGPGYSGRAWRSGGRRGGALINGPLISIGTLNINFNFSIIAIPVTPFAVNF